MVQYIELGDIIATMQRILLLTRPFLSVHDDVTAATGWRSAQKNSNTAAVLWASRFYSIKRLGAAHDRSAGVRRDSALLLLSRLEHGELKYYVRTRRIGLRCGHGVHLRPVRHMRKWSVELER